MKPWKLTPNGQGILIAADEKIEWLLPWWWKRYSARNHLPVAFVDLGMSHYGQTFCAERGKLISLEVEQVSFEEAPTQWDNLFGKQLKESRQSWFKKPFALLATPFIRTLWLDLDCEVLQPLDELFNLEEGIYLAKETENSIERERSLQILASDQMLYNSGVILYSHRESLIEKWAMMHLQEKEQFYSDQHALSHLIHIHAIPVQCLHENYNWRMSQGLNIQAAIIHWVGSWGKDYIRQYGGIADDLEAIPANLEWTNNSIRG